jgi:hypothetical protein
MKYIRIILSPIYFIMFLLGGIIIPVWILTFFLGLCNLIMCVLKEDYTDIKELVTFTFSFITIPYLETINFINNKL